MPFVAPTPVPTITAVGVAKPSAHGHAMQRTVIANWNACSNTDSEWVRPRFYNEHKYVLWSYKGLDKTAINPFGLYILYMIYSDSCFYCSSWFLTGSIVCSAKRQLFKLFRGRFWGFSPRRGNTLNRWGEIWRGRGPLLHAKYHPHRCNNKGIGPKNRNFYWNLIKMWNIKALHDFHKICRVCTPFQDVLPFKISLDLLKGLWSYGNFKLRGSGFSQIFSAP